MPRRYITIREDNVLTPMTEERFYSVLGHIDRDQVDVLYPAELKEFVRLCRALMSGKDIIFTHHGNEDVATKWAPVRRVLEAEGDEKLFAVVTRSSNVLSGSLRIVSEHNRNTPVEWLKEQIHLEHPDRWIFIIRGKIVGVKSAPTILETKNGTNS